MKKVQLDFDLLQKMIDMKRTEIKNKIYSEFEAALKQAEAHVEAYGRIKERLNYFKDMQNRINEIGLVEKFKVKTFF